MRISANFLKTWMNCPLQAKFHYVDKLPEPQSARATFGNCVHHALEVFEQTRDIEKAIEAFELSWDDPSTIGRAIDVWPKFTNWADMHDRGISLLRKYDEKEKWDRTTILGTEYKFDVPVGKHNMIGYIDRLEIKKTIAGVPTLRIVDYKTASRQPTLSELRLNIQFTCYDYATRQKEFWVGNGSDCPGFGNGEELYEQFKDMPRRGIWWGLALGKELDAGERDEADFLRLYRVVNEIERALKYEVFVPCIDGTTCNFCPYTKPCGLPFEPRPNDEIATVF